MKASAAAAVLLRGHIGLVVAGSLAARLVAAALLVAAPFIPPTEAGVTGAVLCGLALGWAGRCWPCPRCGSPIGSHGAERALTRGPRGAWVELESLDGSPIRRGNRNQSGPVRWNCHALLRERFAEIVEVDDHFVVDDEDPHLLVAGRLAPLRARGSIQGP